MEWVRIEDGLPELGAKVDVWIDGRRAYVNCWRAPHKNGDGWIWMRLGSGGYGPEYTVRNQHRITHWLKIEPPPKATV